MAKDRKPSPEAAPEPAHLFGGGRGKPRTGQKASEDLGAVKAPQIEDTAPQDGTVSGSDLAVLDSEAQALDVVQPDRGIGCRMPYENYRAIVLLLREGVPLVTLADRFGVSRSTIQMLKERHQDIIPSHRQTIIGKSENLRELLSDRMTEAVANGKMSPNQYAFTYGIVSDKYHTETGQNGSKHEHIHVSVDKNDLGSLLSGANAKTADYESATDDDLPHKNSVDV